MRITTDGHSRILIIEDFEDAKPTLSSPVALNSNPVRDRFKYFTFTLGDSKSGEAERLMQIKKVDFRMQGVVCSLIHRKKEILTIFMSDVIVKAEETPEFLNVWFSVGFLQVDN